jgi:hypothetical protein
MTYSLKVAVPSFNVYNSLVCSMLSLLLKPRADAVDVLGGIVKS